MFNFIDAFRFLSDNLIIMWDDAGRINGLKDNDLGQIGVRIMQGTKGWVIDPPAESEYAVEPVGVENTSPSPVVVVKNSLSM